jgi:hypothetical protein
VLEESTFIRVIYGEAEDSGWKFESGIPDIFFWELVCALSKRRRFKTVPCG